MSTDLILFLLAASLLFIGLATLKIGTERNELFGRTHYFILTLAALLGICSFVFALASIKLTLENINIFLYCLLLITATTVFCFGSKTPRDLFAKPTFSKKTGFVLLVSHLVAIVAGFLIFSSDLIPSSMTGDPARHFLRIVILAGTNDALAFKPIYTVSGLLFIQAFSSIPQDEAFVIFNILILGLSTAGCMIFSFDCFHRSDFGNLFL